MLDTRNAVYEYLRAVFGEDGDWDTADEYGEPGYRTEGTTSMVILGYYWCKCGKVKDNEGREAMHDFAHHYPKAFARMEDNGVKFEWQDEWARIDIQREKAPGEWEYVSKAYRTQADSYSWQPSVILTEDGEWMSPDDPIDVWIDWAVNDPSRCIPSAVHSGTELEAAGFERWSEHFESGWYGREDSPTDIDRRIRAVHDDDELDIIFMLDSNAQFAMGFSAWYRVHEDEDAE